MNLTVVDGLEKAGRLALWLALATAIVLTPLGMRAQAKEAARAAEQASADLKAEQKRVRAEQEKQAAEKLARLSIKSMGELLTGKGASTAQVWFTNVSPRSGFVCVIGRAKSPKGETSSLPACEHVEPYSAATIKMAFATDSIAHLCPQFDCAFAVEDAPDAAPKELAMNSLHAAP